MGGIDRDIHWPWLGFALDQAMERGLYEPKDVVHHATPEVLVSQLPNDVLVALLSRALATETLTPKSVIETAPPSLLAEHLEPEVMWKCLKEIAERAGLVEKGRTRTQDARNWLGAILQGAIETELLGAADVMRHLPPAEFVGHTPLPVMAELIKAGLLGGKFDPSLVLQHLTPQVMADHLETALVWSAIEEAALARYELGQSRGTDEEKTKPAREEETGKIAMPSKKNGHKVKEARIEPVVSRKAPKGESTGPFELPKSEDWAHSDELDVVEESPLPPPPIAVAKPRTT
jgi:hypothetical protein